MFEKLNKWDYIFYVVMVVVTIGLVCYLMKG